MISSVESASIASNLAPRHANRPTNLTVEKASFRVDEYCLNLTAGRAITQEVSPWRPTAAARVQNRV
jgi:hypothetical protein